MNPSLTLRRIAEIATNDEVKRLATQLANELELQHNKQNNEFAIALGNAELGWSNQVDAIVARLDAHDERDAKIMEMIGAMQQELSARVGRLEERQVNDDASHA